MSATSLISLLAAIRSISVARARSIPLLFVISATRFPRNARGTSARNTSIPGRTTFDVAAAEELVSAALALAGAPELGPAAGSGARAQAAVARQHVRAARIVFMISRAGVSGSQRYSPSLASTRIQSSPAL
jgi:hypothetical protein